jgi:thioredoxin
MKRIFLFGWLIALLLVACNGKSQPSNNPQVSSLSQQSSSTQGKETPASASSKTGGQVIYLTTQDFINKVFDYRNNKEWKFKGARPCVIDFYADWCRPCKMVSPIMEELAGEYNGKIDFYKVNTDKEQELAAAFNIQSIPSVLFCPKDGKPAMAVGAYPKEEYIRMINQVIYQQKQ